MTNNQLTKEWLHNRIADIESTRDDIPFGFDESGNNELAAFKLALAAMDSEPDRNPALAYADSYRDMAKQGVESVPIWSVITDLERNIAPLYRRAQPSPVVPDDVLEALQKVARIRLDLNDFDGDHRGLSFCLSDAEETLIDVVNRRAAMLQESKKSAGAEATCRSNENAQVLNTIKAPPALDSLPKTGEVQNTDSPVIPDGYVMVPVEPTKEILDEFDSIIDYGAEDSVDAWHRLLAAAPQEVKGE
ncbi:hypothetical protein C0Q74_08765 [Klebsiella pneumoniae]|uniref:hypothetical protein n=1 Tax=Klebsiella pneumoniae TaxID=573 RepID=UPI00217F260E|nr:hypothetical protein [Klebsiella pneumoniae]MBX4728629.1 hypothetical protein [Klebsiella pneumoniae]